VDLIAAVAVFVGGAYPGLSADGFQALFPTDGIPEGWSVRTWSDVKNPAPENVHWKVIDGVLHGSEPRGTWLVSDQEYDDFVLEFEWKLGERGNSGCGLRFPPEGDPAFDGLELQMVDPRYYGDAVAEPFELTGSLYRSVRPREQRYKPTDWNQYRITCRGSLFKVLLNGETILDLDLDETTQSALRHDGTEAPPLRDRPRRGRIGFQELSRGGGHVEIRNARIKILH
jgi:hypothetical protein